MRVPLLGGVLGVALAAGLGLVPIDPAGADLPPGVLHPGAPSYGGAPRLLPPAPKPATLTVLSSPDFLNADVGDLTGLPTWDGLHNSTNASYEESLGVVLDQMAAEQPDQVLVAGDLVEGHWGVDVDNSGAFGPVDNAFASLAAIGQAGRFYYGAWAQRFADHGLPRPHVAVGDHEIGDNPWTVGSLHAYAVPWYKRAFADALVGERYGATHRPVGTAFERTSYWTPLSDDVMLVSVDVFRQTSTGRVVPSLTGAHLRWFRKTLALGQRRFRWVVVQAHTPILRPVRSTGSSHLRLTGGAHSAMWQAMRRYGVDLYLCGEAHEVTATDPARGPLQVAHGGLMAYGGTRYLRLDFHPGRVELRSYGFDSWIDRSARLWQTSEKRAVPIGVAYQPGVVYRGGAVLRRDGSVIHRSGDLAPATELGLLG